MRHGAAAPPGRGLSDGHRYLTREGRQTCRAVGRALREAGIEFDAIVSSPLLRAAQTAELLADAVDYLGEIQSHVAFTPGAHPKVAVEEIVTRGSAVAVVGHEPYLSDLAAFIVSRPGVRALSPGPDVVLRRAQAGVDAPSRGPAIPGSVHRLSPKRFHGCNVGASTDTGAHCRVYWVQ